MYTSDTVEINGMTYELPHIKYFKKHFYKQFNPTDALDFLHECYATYYKLLPKYDSTKSNLLSFFSMISKNAYTNFIQSQQLVRWKRNTHTKTFQKYEYVSFDAAVTSHVEAGDAELVNALDYMCQDYIDTSHQYISSDLNYKIKKIIASMNIYEWHKDILRARVDNFATEVENRELVVNLRKQYNISVANMSAVYRKLCNILPLYLDSNGNVINQEFYKLTPIVKIRKVKRLTKGKAI